MTPNELCMWHKTGDIMYRVYLFVLTTVIRMAAFISQLIANPTEMCHIMHL